MKKITITEALNELKLYDAKIYKAINSASFVDAAKKSADKVGNIKKETFNERAKASYQSVTDLIKNRMAMKSAIVKSNATTTLEVAGRTMTVAEAIEYKSSIEYEQALLNTMTSQYNKASAKNDKENKRVDDKVDELLATLIGKDSDKKIDEASQKAVEEPYRKNNEFELVDPLSVFDKISALDEKVSSFLSEVDSKLSISNSTTFIEVEI